VLTSNNRLSPVFPLLALLALSLIINVHVEASNQSNETKFIYINIENNMTKKYAIVFEANNKTLTKIEVTQQVINKTIYIPIANNIRIKITLNNNTTKTIKLPINLNKYYINIISQETKEYELILIIIQRENIKPKQETNIKITPNPLGLGISQIEIKIRGNFTTLNPLIKAFKIGKYSGSLNYFLKTRHTNNTLNIILDTHTYPVISYNDTLSIDITSNNRTTSMILTIKEKEEQPKITQKDEETKTNYTITYTIGKNTLPKSRKTRIKISSSDVIEYVLLLIIILLLGVQKAKKLSRFSTYS